MCGIPGLCERQGRQPAVREKQISAPPAALQQLDSNLTGTLKMWVCCALPRAPHLFFFFSSKRKYIIEANCVTYGQRTRRVGYHRRRETHSKHKTLSYLARTRIKVPFSALPSFGGRGPTGRSSLKTSLLGPVLSLLPFVTFCHLFCLELVNFSIAAWTSSSWWACGGLQSINFILRQGGKTCQACFWQHLEPSHCNAVCPCCQAAISLHGSGTD